MKFSDYTKTETTKVNEEKSLQDEYQEYFTALLKKYKVSSPADLEEEDMKKFFNDVTSGWVKGKGEK